MHRSDLISQDEGDFVIRQSNCFCNCKDLSGYVVAVISPDNGAADSKERRTPNYQEARSVALSGRAFLCRFVVHFVVHSVVQRYLQKQALHQCLSASAVNQMLHQMPHRNAVKQRLNEIVMLHPMPHLTTNKTTNKNVCNYLTQ